MDIWTSLVILIPTVTVQGYIIEDVLDTFSQTEQKIIKYNRDFYFYMPKECRKGNKCLYV